MYLSWKTLLTLRLLCLGLKELSIFLTYRLLALIQEMTKYPYKFPTSLESFRDLYCNREMKHAGDLQI